MSRFLSRRDAILQSGFAAAFLTLGLTSRSFAQSSGDVLNGLAREIDPLTRAMRGHTVSIADWREGLVEIYNRVDLDDIMRDMDFEALAARTGYAERGVTTAPVRMSLENGGRLSFFPKMFAVGEGRAIVPHGHENMVSAHLTLSGQFHLRQYDKLAVEDDALLIRQTVDEVAGPGALSSISEAKDNVHWFLATENAHTLDVVVMGLDPAAEQSFDIYNLDIDGASREAGDILRAPRISVPDALRLYG